MLFAPPALEVPPVAEVPPMLEKRYTFDRETRASGYTTPLVIPPFMTMSQVFSGFPYRDVWSAMITSTEKAYGATRLGQSQVE